MKRNWSEVPLGEILTERQETPDDGALASGEIPIVSKISFNDGKIILRDDGATKTGMILARQGDLLVSGINAAKGAIAVYNGESPIAATIHYGAYIPNKKLVDVNYLWWLLRSQAFKDLLIKYVPGGIKTELKSKRLLPIPIPLPPVEKQKNIVAFIKSFIALQEQICILRQQVVSDKESLLANYLDQLFGNPYENICGKIKIKNWVRLESLVDDVADGPHITPTYIEDGVPFLTVQNITSGQIQFGNHKYISEEDHQIYQKRAKANSGDVLLSKDGTIGIPCIVNTEREFSFFVSVALIKPKKNVLNGEFLVWVLRTPYLQKRIVEKSRGDMIRHLVLREIRDLSVPVLPITQQMEIVSALNQLKKLLDKTVDTQVVSGAKLNSLSLSVLNNVFKGEL